MNPIWIIVAVAVLVYYNLKTSHDLQKRLWVNAFAVIAILGMIFFISEEWLWLSWCVAALILTCLLATRGWAGLWHLAWILPAWWLTTWLVNNHGRQPKKEMVNVEISPPKHNLIPTNNGESKTSLEAGSLMIVDTSAFRGKVRYDGPVDLLIPDADYDWGLPNEKWGMISEGEVRNLGIKLTVLCRRYPKGDPRDRGNLNLSGIVAYRVTKEKARVEFAFHREAKDL